MYATFKEKQEIFHKKARCKKLYVYKKELCVAIDKKITKKEMLFDFFVELYIPLLLFFSQSKVIVEKWKKHIKNRNKAINVRHREL